MIVSSNEKIEKDDNDNDIINQDIIESKMNEIEIETVCKSTKWNMKEEGNVVHASNENNPETTIEMQNITEEIIIKSDIIQTISIKSKENEESISCSLNLA
eukprot:246264_1